MGSKYNPWVMLHNTDMNENLEEVTETDDCKVLKMSDSGGDVLMTVYRSRIS